VNASKSRQAIPGAPIAGARIIRSESARCKMGVIIWPALPALGWLRLRPAGVRRGQQKDDQMHINEDAVSSAAFSLAKVLVAELMRKGIFDREELISAISSETEELRKIATATNEDAATLLTVYCEEL
jgi:hypothetical protein